MPKSSESEILAKIFADMAEKCRLIEFFRGRPRGGDNFTLHFPSAPDPSFKASESPFPVGGTPSSSTSGKKCRNVSPIFLASA